jgi:hypothetical protein
MHFGGIRNFPVRISTRTARLAIVGCVLVAAPVVWTVRQSWLTRDALRRATVAEKAAANAQSDADQARAQLGTGGKPRKDPAVRRSRHDDPQEIARVKALYEEIDSLSRIQERVEDDLTATRRITAKQSAKATAPARTPSAKATAPARTP